MERGIAILTRTALFIFLLISAGMIAYEFLYVIPARKCEAASLWWDPRDRECLTPIPIWRITGRLPDHVVPAPPVSTPPAAPGKR
jgi:hypothetical protein